MPNNQASKKSKKSKRTKRSLRLAKEERIASRVTCEHCNATTTDLEGHLDCKHVNRVTVEFWPEELLTVNRSDGFFRCPWCIDRTSRESKTELASARAMEKHLRACYARRPHMGEAHGMQDSDRTHHPAGSAPSVQTLGTGYQSPPCLSQLDPEPKRIVFSSEVTVLPATTDEPISTEVIRSSPTIASLVAELAKDEGVNPLDEEP